MVVPLEGVWRVTFITKFLNLNFSQVFLIFRLSPWKKIHNSAYILSILFWLGIWYESIVWVIIRRWGVFSERRRSSCSSLIYLSQAKSKIWFKMWLYFQGCSEGWEDSPQINNLPPKFCEEWGQIPPYLTKSCITFVLNVPLSVDRAPFSEISREISPLKSETWIQPCIFCNL